MLLLWLLVPAAIIGLAMACIALAIWLILKWRNKANGPPTARPVLAVLGGCGLIPVIALLLLILLPPACNAIRPTEATFKESFGIGPDASFKNLTSSTDAGLDSRTIFLAWDSTPAASKKTFELMREANVRPETDLLASHIFAQNAPDWFRAGPAWLEHGTCSKRHAQEFERWRQWDDVVIVECLSDGRTYALFSVID